MAKPQLHATRTLAMTSVLLLAALTMRNSATAAERCIYERGPSPKPYYSNGSLVVPQSPSVAVADCGKTLEEVEADIAASAKAEAEARERAKAEARADAHARAQALARAQYRARVFDMSPAGCLRFLADATDRWSNSRQTAADLDRYQADTLRGTACSLESFD